MWATEKASPPGEERGAAGGEACSWRMGGRAAGGEAFPGPGQPDDGTDKGGGWQVAKAHLPFIRIYNFSRTEWYCDLKIEMPLRTKLMGKIPATLAASISAQVSNSVSKGMDFELPPGTFCFDFVEKMKTAFKSEYKDLGARLTR